MGEILGLGMSHFPGFIQEDGEMTLRIKLALQGDRLPPDLKDLQNWPAPMRAEWGNDEGLSFASKHRADFVAHVRRLRAALDDFRPDLVLIFGDDQNEEFQDIVPPFCIYLAQEFESQPFMHVRGQGVKPNVWGEPPDKKFVTRGHPEAAHHLLRDLLAQNFDVAYCRRSRHELGLAHAFIRSVIYLDYDRKGWDYPVLPFHVNAWGTHLANYRKGELTPPSPTPERCFEVGRAVGRIIRASPWRVALVASSSWSHGILTGKHHYFYPDVDADRQRYRELQAGDFTAWRDLQQDEMVGSGQDELVNWILLAGAMHELDYVPTWTDLSESYIMNSSKCAALFAPRAAARVPPLPLGEGRGRA
jgi:hypothetical protein